MADHLSWLSLLGQHSVFTADLPSAPPTDPDSDALALDISLAGLAVSSAPQTVPAPAPASAADPPSFETSLRDLTEGLAFLHQPQWRAESDGFGRYTTRSLALRGHDLFVVVQGVEIRLVNLKRCKDVWLEELSNYETQQQKWLEAQNTTTPRAGNGSPEPGATQPKASLDVDFDTHWLRQCAARIPYAVVRVTQPAFPIQAIAINSGGRFLAIMGLYQITVASLPRPGAAYDQGDILRCQGFALAPTLYNPRFSNGLTRIHWHPLSSNHVHLMVLGTDGVLRMFNVVKSLERPEQTHHFSTADTRSRRTPPRRTGSYHAFGADLDTHEAADFCLGHSSELTALTRPIPSGHLAGSTKPSWSVFTVYVLMKNGDIYSLAPYMPHESICPRSLLDTMSLNIRTLFESHSALTEVDGYGNFVSTTGPSTPLIHPTQLLYTKQWLARLEDTAVSASIRSPKPATAESPSSSADTEMVRVTWPFVRMKPLPVGPYLLQPAPPELVDHSPSACSILCLDVQPFGALAVAFEHGQIDLYLQLQPVVPQWAMDSIADGTFLLGGKLPVLVSYESIDLGLETAPPLAPVTALARNPLDVSSQPSGSGASISASVADTIDQDDDNPTNSHVTLVADPLYIHTVYAYHQQGVHSIDIEKWYRRLCHAAYSEDSTEPGAPPDSPLGRKSTEVVDPSTTAALTTDPNPNHQLDPALVNRDILSNVDWVVCTQPLPTSLGVPITGLLAFNDVYLSYALGMMTRSREFVGLELSIRYESLMDMADMPGSLLRSATGENTTRTGEPTSQCPGLDGVKYLPKLPLPAFTVPPELDRQARKPTTVLVDGQSELGNRKIIGVELTEDNVKYFGDCVTELMNQVANIGVTDAMIQERLALQVQEHDRQAHVVAQKTDELHNHLIHKQTQTLTKLKHLRQTQTDLANRYDRLLQKLTEINQPILTPEERNYYDELKRMDKLIRDNQGLEIKAERLEEALHTLKQGSTPPKHQSQRSFSFKSPPPPGTPGGLLGLNRPDGSHSATTSPADSPFSALDTYGLPTRSRKSFSLKGTPLTTSQPETIPVAVEKEIEPHTSSNLQRDLENEQFMIVQTCAKAQEIKKRLQALGY
ncbi:hypothetical protein H4R33_004393 [Dimargaris cristalligena]|nr:hypothetical protein H4R33_004393 [Dimargaris cristalligena]